MRGLSDAMAKALKQKCEDQGFKKDKNGIWYRFDDIFDSFYHTLFFNPATYQIGRSITAYVGIGNSWIDKLFLKLSNQNQTTHYVLLRINIGDLNPSYGKYKDWFYTDFQQIPEICDTIFKEIRKYAYPFFEEYQNFEKIIEVFEKKTKGFGIDINTRFYTQPLLYSAIGEHDKGIELISLIKDLGYIKLESQETYYRNYIKYAMEQKEGK